MANEPINLFEPNLMTTGIGSLPLVDPDEAARYVLDADLSAPFWPQLPKRAFVEQMVPQYAEGVPCVRLDREGKSVRFDTSDKDEELQTFYERFLEEEPDRFAVSEQFAPGFYALERLITSRRPSFLKGQVTGPITFATSIKGAQDETLYSDPELRDVAVKALTRKAEWQIDRLSPLAGDGVILFVDEPVLAAYGSSAYVGILAENVHEIEGEIFEAVHERGAISGIHVCGNCDWGMIVGTGVKVINFDAYQYGESISLYPEEVAAYLARGGCIAWGIVPTTEAIHEENAESLTRRLEGHMNAVVAKGIDTDLLRRRSILTPSCGAGSLGTAEARRVFELLRETRAILHGSAS